MRFKDIQNDVMHILLNVPEARENDGILYVCVCERRNPQAGFNSFNNVMANVALYGLPTIESVSRARRKIASKYPELAPKRTAKRRAELTQEFRGYALAKGV